MAPVLKRKGGPVEAANTPKRVKSQEIAAHRESKIPKVATPAPVLDQPKPIPNLAKSGWDAAFGVPRDNQQIALIDGAKDGEMDVQDSDASEEYDVLDKQSKAERLARANSRKRTREPAKDFGTAIGEGLSVSSEPARSEWKVSHPVGGRMLDLDPIFVDNERYVVVAQRNSLRVYSTSNSLLNRVVNLGVQPSTKPDDRIVAFCSSTTDSNLIWIAHSTGAVYCIDWTSGAGAEDFWLTSNQSTTYMAVASIESAGRTRDVVYTTEQREEGGWRIQAHELTAPGSPIATVARTIYASTEEIQVMKASADGAVIAASSGSRILLGQLRSSDFDMTDKIRYTFRVFESSDPIQSIDLRVTTRATASDSKKDRAFVKVPVVDVVVGDVRGAIFVHDDLLSNLIRAEAASADDQSAVNLLPRKLHWHRKTVNCVKWSSDGNYIISGGSETVLVLWQLDTGKHQYLPHMTAAIQNIVVSPTGSSYAIRLGDNSTMVLSTAELEPTANISGIQAHVIKTGVGLGALVERVKQEKPQRPFMERTPALIHPSQPSQLLVAVGDTQEVDPTFASKNSVPYLQTFDIGTSHNISRQALTRTNVTGKIEAPNAQRIDEARITHIQISGSGKWLATIDEWMPPRRDVAFLGHKGTDLTQELRRRREVHLKFWKWSEKEQTWALVTRVDAPHTIANETSGAGQVLSLAADSSSLAFSTLGEDSHVRTWRPRTRRRDGVVVTGSDGEPLVDWKCQHTVSLGQPDLIENDKGSYVLYPRPEHASLVYSEDGSILAAALSNTEDRIVYLVDNSNGTIKSSRPGLYSGDILHLAFLEKYLIILADELLVYDLVTDDLQYQIALGHFRSLMSLEQKAHMMHLTIDPKSRTFAVALPTSTLSEGWLNNLPRKRGFLDAAKTEIAIFNPELATPLITHTLSAFATAVMPAVGSEGYIVLDAAAEITPILPKAVLSVTSTAQPLADSTLDVISGDDVAEKGLTELIDEHDEDEEMEDAADEGAEDLEDDGPRVVSQQALARVFDGTPAFAMPPIEEMFYQVAGLFSSKRQQ